MDNPSRRKINHSHARLSRASAAAPMVPASWPKAAGQDHQVVLEGTGKLGEQMVLEGLEQQFAGTGDAAADDDGLRD